MDMTTTISPGISLVATSIPKLSSENYLLRRCVKNMNVLIHTMLDLDLDHEHQREKFSW